MEYIIISVSLTIYYVIGVMFYAAYWRYSEASLSNAWDKIWGNCWLMFWPLALTIGILLLPFSLIDSIPLKMTAKRQQRKPIEMETDDY